MIRHSSLICRTASTIASKASDFRHARRGTIAIMFALLLIPMLGAIGLAIDYSRALSLHAKAQTAADGAALLTVNLAKENFKKKGNPANPYFIMADARIRGSEFFKSHADKVQDGKMRAFVQLERKEARFKATVTYLTELDTSLGRVLGYKEMSGHAVSESTSTTALNYDIYLFLDISQSMGLGATQQDMSALFEETGKVHGASRSCVFGCHVPEFDNSYERSKPTNSQIARSNGIRMRIDVLKDAVKDMIKEAKKGIASGEADYRIGIRTFSRDSQDISDLTDDMGALETLANRIDLGPNRPPGVADSNIDDTLRNTPGRQFFTEPSGTGLSSDSPKKFLFLITDGVNDTYGACGTHCTGPVDPDKCKHIKDKGITLGVIYTTYLPIWLDNDIRGGAFDSRYATLVDPFSDRIKPDLEQCASPGWFIEATYEDDIHDAFQTLFTQITQPPTLVN